jgi:glyoxalase family protein
LIFLISLFTGGSAGAFEGVRIHRYKQAAPVELKMTSAIKYRHLYKQFQNLIMENKILGLHHITAIAGNAKRNYEFYTKIIGLRMVKKTVNFDDPGTYHFYFGDEKGTPGTILTFFPWEGIGQGRTGTGMATGIGYSVPKDSLAFWADRFKKFNVKYDEAAERFGEQYLPFRDPDGLNIDLIVSNNEDGRKPWETEDVKADVATKGFHSITLTLKNMQATAEILNARMFICACLSVQAGILYNKLSLLQKLS